MSPPGPVRRRQYPAGVRCEKHKPLHRLCVLVIDRRPPGTYHPEVGRFLVASGRCLLRLVHGELPVGS
jgi:hypothetical protein